MGQKSCVEASKLECLASNGGSYSKQYSLIGVQLFFVLFVESFNGVRLETNMLTVYGYGSTGGTDPATSVPATSAPYGNSTWSYYPSGTAPYSTGTDPTTTYGTVSGGPYSTGDPSVTKTVASTGDPSGAAGSTGLDPSGKPTYTAPTGIPSEYYYHHKKPKRNVRRSSSFPHPTAMKIVC